MEDIKKLNFGWFFELFKHDPKLLQELIWIWEIN